MVIPVAIGHKSLVVKRNLIVYDIGRASHFGAALATAGCCKEAVMWTDQLGSRPRHVRTAGTRQTAVYQVRRRQVYINHARFLHVDAGFQVV